MDRHTPLDSPRWPESEARKGPASHQRDATVGIKTTSSSQLPNECAQVFSSNRGDILCYCYDFDVLLGMDQHIAVIELDAPLLHPLDDLQRKTHSYSAADMNTIRTHTYTAWGLKTRLGRERRACRQISG